MIVSSNHGRESSSICRFVVGFCSKLKDSKARCGLFLGVISSGSILAESKVSSRPVSGRAVVARTLWGLLALIHVWPFIAVLMKLTATPTLDRAASLLLLVALIAFSTAKAVGIRLLRSDRPRMELMVWLLAGGILHGGDIRDVDRMEFVSLAAGAGIGSTWIARRENRRRIVNFVCDAIDAGTAAIVRCRLVLGDAGVVLETADIRHGHRLCERGTCRPPPPRA